MFKLVLSLIILTPYVLGEKFRYDNYTLYKLQPTNVDQIKLLQNLQDNDLRFDFWSDPMPSAEFVNILSSPQDKNDLENFLNTNDIRFGISMENIQEAIDKEKVKTYTRSNLKTMRWDAYYDQDAINAWIDDLAATYPDIVTIVIGGTSYEGRQIKGLKISHGKGRRIVFLEGGIHASEWISPATVNYIANELLTSNDEETKAAARGFDWHIFPVINPDGYMWTHEQNRMWRKNRRPNDNTTIGVDLNRNWNNNWRGAGSSSNPASNQYAGLSPFSEPETRTLSTYISSIGDKIDLYLNFHSYGQMLLLPFGNTTEPLANYHDAVNIGRRAMGALSVKYGTTYITGNIAEVIYMATGSSLDWVKEAHQVPLVYCYELRGNQNNVGLMLPTEEILPNNEEVMDSVIELIHQAKRFGYMNIGSGLKAPLVMMGLAILIKFFL